FSHSRDALTPPLHSSPTRRSSDLSPFDMPPRAHIRFTLPPAKPFSANSAKAQATICSLLREFFSACLIALSPFLSQYIRPRGARSEEHTSELQSRFDLVCRLLLEK